MGRTIYSVKPMAALLHLESPPFNAPALGAQWPTINTRVFQNRVERRWDTEIFRTFADGDVIQHVPIFKRADGTYVLLALTATDLILIRTGTNETYSYLTDAYTTGTVTDVSGYVVTGSGTSWLSSGLEPGDKLILSADHSANVEPDVNWGTISSIDTDTRIFLTENYTGTTGAMSDTYLARKVYSCPDGERWQYSNVAGKFCFVNSNDYAQYWDGTDPESGGSFAKNLDTTYANKVKYCTTYANRLILANLYNDDIAAVDPWLLRTSAEGDPTNFTDQTAVDYNFIETQEPICGVGSSEGQLVVFKKTGYYIGARTGDANDPLTFRGPFPGVGLYSPYSLVNYMGGLLAWIGADDFYTMSGSTAVAIGASIRHKFFTIVSEDDLARTYAMNSAKYNEILWVANTSEGQKVIVWNYKENTWGCYEFSPNLSGLGGFGT